MTIPRRRFLHLAAGAAALPAVSRFAWAQSYPTPDRALINNFRRAVRSMCWCAFSRSSSRTKLGQSFIVENRPRRRRQSGDRRRNEQPTGWLRSARRRSASLPINQYLYERMPFDAEQGYHSGLAHREFPNVLVVATKHVPATTMREFIAWAKAPGNITFGSQASADLPHLSAALFSTRTGINATHVPFRGAAQTIPTMLAGDVTFALDNLASYTGTIRGRPNARTPA